jgi:hypothetical protein
LKGKLSITEKFGMQHTAFPTRKITMSDTQLTQEERYHIQDLSGHHTIIE